MTFAEFNFNPHLLKGIEAVGYKQPTPIQLRSIPEILAGKDLVASAQTGTGKTAAFVLPALQRLSLAKSTVKPRVLVLTPTRELASQIVDAAKAYGKFLRFNLLTLVGGASYRYQLKGLSRPCDMIVATPGRLLDHLENKKIDLSAIEMLILDEADRMLDMGFIEDVKHIAKATPHTRQTLLFSATVDENLSQVVRQLLKHPTRIDVSAEKMAPVSIKQELYIADSIPHKMRLLQYFLTETSIFKAIIFSATKVNADKLTDVLRAQGLSIAALHGDLKQAVRNRTIEQFRRGKIQYLVATDVVSRGIDVSDVTHVINYDLPKFSEDYVHRIGRTGRAGKTGIAISFALPIDGRHLQRIERYIGQRLEVSTIPGLEATKSLMAGKTSSFGGKKKQAKGHASGFSSKKSWGDKRHASGKGKPFADKFLDGKKSKDKKYGDGFRSSRAKFGSKESADHPSFKDGKKSGGTFGGKAFGDTPHAAGVGKKPGSKKGRGHERSTFGSKTFSDTPHAAGDGKKSGGKKWGSHDRLTFSGKASGNTPHAAGDSKKSSGKKFKDNARSSGKTFSGKSVGDTRRSAGGGDNHHFASKKAGGKKPNNSRFSVDKTLKGKKKKR